MKIGMIGPGLDVPGGMTAVHRTWLEARAMDGVEVEYFPTMGMGDRLTKIRKMAAGQARFLRALAGGYRPDVFHIHLSDSVSFYRKMIYFQEARATGMATVVHLHGAEFEKFHDARRVNADMIHRMFRQATVVLCLTDITKKTVERWTGGRARTRVLHNSVVVERFNPVLEGRRHDRPPTVLFMGEVGERKGTFDLMAAVPSIIRRVPTARFIFGGNGEVERLETMAAELGVADSVKILGWISGPEKLQAFQDADVFCLPSYFENFPVAILEAMAAGMPTVSTMVAGIPESVEHGETGFLVTPGDRDALGDHIARLLEDKELRDRMGVAAREGAQARFDNEIIVEKLKAIWSEAARIERGHEEAGP